MLSLRDICRGMFPAKETSTTNVCPFQSQILLNYRFFLDFSIRFPFNLDSLRESAS